MATTVRDAKCRLTALLEKLNRFKDDDIFVVELDDNCGGSYIADIETFDVGRGAGTQNDKIWLTNF